MLKRFATLQPLQLPLCLSDTDTLDLPITTGRTAPRLRLGLWLWAIMTAVISIIAVIQPHRCISWIYRQAAEAWATASPLYAPGLHGFLYFPTGTLVYGPFALLLQPLDSHAWRLFLSASLVLAVRRYAHMLAPGAGAAVAGMILALTIPAAVIDLLRGQMTLLMAAILLVAAADAADGNHRRAGFWLALAVFVKPLALVPAMLIIVALPAAGPSFAASLLIGVAASMLHPHPDYAMAQWVAMIDKLRFAAAPDSGTWFDIGALLKRLGLIGPTEPLFGLRLAAALSTLILALLAARRFETRTAVICCLHLGCCYLLLWNPRVEEGSYVMLALLVGGQAAVAIRTPGHERQALFAMCLCLAVGTHLYGDWIYRPTAFWIKQVAALIHMAALSWDIAVADLFHPPPQNIHVPSIENWQK
ncbi:glycosyltransferase family 87 protein [Azospirillum sp. TSA6c]|uniref:glycosyltransferase family 87 protein n=1 Tax=unclassified Azospirillum TaxID=2630922 RepID=UPI000D641E2E|nr:glycosyltransferase family 87 protein [Azospirillum sp. TSA6c]